MIKFYPSEARVVAVPILSGLHHCYPADMIFGKDRLSKETSEVVGKGARLVAQFEDPLP